MSNKHSSSPKDIIVAIGAVYDRNRPMFERTKECITRVKDTPPKWWEEQFSQVKLCPSLQDYVRNSVVVRAPSDIIVKYTEEGIVLSTSMIESDTVDPIVTITHNPAEESGSLYEHWGAINLKVQFDGVTFMSKDGSPLRTIFGPPLYYQRNLFNSNFTTTTGEVVYSTGFHVPTLAMLLVPSKHSKSEFVIPAGTEIANIYFVDGIRSIEYLEYDKMPTRYRSSRIPGKNYKDSKYRKGNCPFGFNKSFMSKIKSLFR